jgi:hypothetical protein
MVNAGNGLELNMAGNTGQRDEAACYALEQILPLPTQYRFCHDSTWMEHV